MKHSPGCKCCRDNECTRVFFKWAPSSPYDRGEYTDDDQWTPYTEYHQGDEFWQWSEDRNGDLQRFLYKAPQTMFSGGGWTQVEEDRYYRGKAISYADGLDDFELFGHRWPLDQIELDAALQTRRMSEGQGIVSREDVAQNEWYVAWKSDSSDFAYNTDYDDMEMESLRLKVKFMGSAEYDSENDTEPTSGVVTLFTKAAPMERVDRPYPQDCFRLCQDDLAHSPDLEDQCGPPPPYHPQFKIQHGTFQGGHLELDDTWSKSVEIATRAARTVQPVGGAVVGALDIQSLIGVHNEPSDTVLDLHEYAVAVDVFGRSLEGFIDNGPIVSMNPEIQNMVVVATSSGSVDIGNGPINVSEGDLIQIVDFLRVTGGYFGEFDNEKGQAYLHIPADQIAESERTVSLNSIGRGYTLDTWNNDIVYDGPMGAAIGGKIALYVEELSDTDIGRTMDGSYYIKFSDSICVVETPATVDSPECKPVPAYECNGRLLNSYSTPLDLTSIGSYNYAIVEDIYDFPDQSLGEQLDGSINTVGDDAGINEVFYSFVNSLVDEDETWVGPGELPDIDTQDCQSPSGHMAFLMMWKLYKSTVTNQFSFGKDLLVDTYWYETRVVMFWQRDEIQVHDCIGPDRFVVARSIVDVTGRKNLANPYDDVGDAIPIGGGGATQQWTSEVLARQAIARSITYMLNLLQNDAERLLCGYNAGGQTTPRWRNDMTKANSPTQSPDWYIGGGNNPVNNQAASLHTMELVKGEGGGRAMAVTLNYPTKQMQDAQLGFRGWDSLVVNRSPYTNDVSFENQTVVIGTQ